MMKRGGGAQRVADVAPHGIAERTFRDNTHLCLSHSVLSCNGDGQDPHGILNRAPLP